MHFTLLVLTDEPVTRENAQDVIEPMLEPYWFDQEYGGPQPKWDWRLIGGRWTGALDGYNPALDPANMGTCSLCDGTGERRRPPRVRNVSEVLFKEGRFGGLIATSPDDTERLGGDCEHCNGSGMSLIDPGFWRPHDGDVQPVSSIPEEFVP
jgi:hypothetical protein